MASDGKIGESHPVTTSPPISAAAPPPAAVAAAIVLDSAASSSHLARSAFVVLAALMSVSFFVEPFADAAVDLRLPWSAVVVSLVLLCASFGATVRLFVSFFLPQPPPAIAALAAQPVRVGAISIAAVGIGAVACLVAAGGSTYGFSKFNLTLLGLHYYVLKKGHLGARSSRLCRFRGRVRPLPGPLLSYIIRN